MKSPQKKIILVINPGSTSTKIALYQDETLVWDEKISHGPEQLAQFKMVWDQYEFREQEIIDFLSRKKIAWSQFDAIVGRGGLLKPLAGGTYRVDARMLADARANLQGEHVSNLGCALADGLAKQVDCPAFVVDPVSVDEFEAIARYSGHPLIARLALSHALNLHAAARKAAEQTGTDYRQANFIVAHLGGGISVAPIKDGRIIDVNDASSDGPFSPERSGGLPLQPFIKLCFSGQYSMADMKKMVMGQGGLVAYLGTHDIRLVEQRIQQGDQKAQQVFRAMAYQIAKEIGAMATVLAGQVQAIVLTGGAAQSKLLTDWISKSVSFIAPVILLPGEFEMEAMAHGALRVLRQEEEALKYEMAH